MGEGLILAIHLLVTFANVGHTNAEHMIARSDVSPLSGHSVSDGKVRVAASGGAAVC